MVSEKDGNNNILVIEGKKVTAEIEWRGAVGDLRIFVGDIFEFKCALIYEDGDIGVITEFLVNSKKFSSGDIEAASDWFENKNNPPEWEK